MLDGLVFPVQIVEQFVNLFDFGVLLLSLEVNELIQLPEVAQIGILETMVPFEQTFYLDAVFWLLGLYSKC